MNLRQMIEAGWAGNAFAGVNLEETPAPSIKGPAHEPDNWRRLGTTSVKQALEEQHSHNLIDPKTWVQNKPQMAGTHTIQSAIDLQSGGPGSGCHGDNCGRPKNPGGQLSWSPKVLKREGLTKSRKTGRVTIPLQAPPRSQVKIVSKAPAGFTITQLKTPTRGRPRGSGTPLNLLNRESSLKGLFRLEQENVRGEGWKGVATIWTAKPQGGDVGDSVSILALRDVGKMAATIKEVRTEGTEGRPFIGQTLVFRFNNFGQAAGFLKARYGVGWKLPKAGTFQ